MFITFTPTCYINEQSFFLPLHSTTTTEHKRSVCFGSSKKLHHLQKNTKTIAATKFKDYRLNNRHLITNYKKAESRTTNLKR